MDGSTAKVYAGAFMTGNVAVVLYVAAAATMIAAVLQAVSTECNWHWCVLLSTQVVACWVFAPVVAHRGATRLSLRQIGVQCGRSHRLWTNCCAIQVVWCEFFYSVIGRRASAIAPPYPSCLLDVTCRDQMGMGHWHGCLSWHTVGTVQATCCPSWAICWWHVLP